MHENPEDWAPGCFDNTRVAPVPGNGLALQAERGSFTSPTLDAPFAATEAILSVNLRHAESASAGMTASLSCSEDGEHWSDWYCMLTWGHESDADGRYEGPEGQVKTDVLMVGEPKRYWRYQVAWSDERKAAAVRRSAVNVYRPSEAEPDSSSGNRTAWGITLDVPFLSQWDVKQHPANKVCSPTSLAMTARFHGTAQSADELSSAAHDKAHDIYGNWPLNMLAVSLYGLKAYVDRGTDLRFLEDRIAAGLPTVVSLAFAEGGLAGAPIAKTDGHLVVVAGFDGSGNPVVRDPAARGADVWLTYDRAQFARAWLGHGGVAYIVEPEA